MFDWFRSKTSSVANTLSDTFSPSLRTPLEQLKDAWKQVEAQCSLIIADEKSDLDDPETILRSSLVQHLNQLVESLVREEQEEFKRAQREKDQQRAAAQANTQSTAVTDQELLAPEVDMLRPTGPCFEHFLNEKIFDKLCAIGLPDRPVGMRQLMTKTICAILQHTRHPILPNMTVHKAVTQFLEICCSRKDHIRPGNRSAFISLLHTLSSKIKDDHSLVGLFFQQNTAADKKKYKQYLKQQLKQQQAALNSTNGGTTAVVSPTPAPMDVRPDEFVLFSVLCSVLSPNFSSQPESHQSDMQQMVWQACMWLAQIPEKDIAKFIIKQSNFTRKLCDSLVSSFQALPPFPDRSPMTTLLQEAHAHPAAVTFWKRLTYVDTLVHSTYQILSSDLCNSFRLHFLEPCIFPLLLDSRESVACWATVFVQNMLSSLESSDLKVTIIQFLINYQPSSADKNTSSTANAEASPDSSTSTLSTDQSIDSSLGVVLLRRLDSLSDALCSSTLDLFLTILSLRDPHIIQILLTSNAKYQSQRTKLDIRPHAQLLQIFKQAMTNKAKQDKRKKIEEDEDDDEITANDKQASDDISAEVLAQIDSQDFDTSFFFSTTSAHYFFSLKNDVSSLSSSVQSESDDTQISSAASTAPLSSSSLIAVPFRLISEQDLYSQFRDLSSLHSSDDFEDYLLDAQMEAQLWIQAWEDQAHKATPTSQSTAQPASSTNASGPSPAEATSTDDHTPATAMLLDPSCVTIDLHFWHGLSHAFFDGVFLRTILNKLESLYDNTFSTNLRLTNILAKLAYCPHPIIHQLLFQPMQENNSNNKPNKVEIDEESEPKTAENDQRTVLSVLKELWNKGIRRASRMPQFAVRKEEARKKLNQMLEKELSISQVSGSMETLDGEKFLQGFIVLEEFLKEWISISDSKSRLYAMQHLARLQSQTQSESSS